MLMRRTHVKSSSTTLLTHGFMSHRSNITTASQCGGRSDSAPCPRSGLGIRLVPLTQRSTATACHRLGCGPSGNEDPTGDVPVGLQNVLLLARKGSFGDGWLLPSTSSARDVI
jgi:hypothetical protein